MGNGNNFAITTVVVGCGGGGGGAGGAAAAIGACLISRGSGKTKCSSQADGSSAKPGHRSDGAHWAISQRGKERESNLTWYRSIIHPFSLSTF